MLLTPPFLAMWVVLQSSATTCRTAPGMEPYKVTCISEAPLWKNNWREMAHPVSTKGFLQPSTTAAMCHPPTSLCPTLSACFASKAYLHSTLCSVGVSKRVHNRHYRVKWAVVWTWNPLTSCNSQWPIGNNLPALIPCNAKPTGTLPSS